MNEDIKKVLLTKEEIDVRVQELGKQISEDYAGKDLLVIVLLKGAAWFATDLTRAIDGHVRVEFMVASSYGNGTSTSGNVKVRLDISENIKGKDVIVGLKNWEEIEGKVVTLDNFLNLVLDDGEGLRVIKGGKIAFISIKE